MQKAIKITLYGTESNHRRRANSAMGMKIVGEGHFDMLKKIGFETNPKIPPFRTRRFPKKPEDSTFSFKPITTEEVIKACSKMQH